LRVEETDLDAAKRKDIVVVKGRALSRKKKNWRSGVLRGGERLTLYHLFMHGRVAGGGGREGKKRRGRSPSRSL